MIIALSLPGTHRHTTLLSFLNCELKPFPPYWHQFIHNPITIRHGHSAVRELIYSLFIPFFYIV